MVVFFHCPGPG